jgi:hypothetical protein
MTVDQKQLLEFVFGAGFVLAIIRQFRKDLKGVGDMTRAKAAEQERRWKFQLAEDIEELEPKEKAHRIAERVRHDAYRN